MKSYCNVSGDYYERAHYYSTKSQEFMYVSREEFLVDFMDLKGTEKILDIGCGSGTFSIMLAKKYPLAKIIGADISEEVIKFATKAKKKEGLNNLAFIVSGIDLLPIKKECFDVIIVSHLIEHLEKPSNAFVQVNLALKKKGALFITTPNYLSLWPLAELVFDRFYAEKGYNLGEQHITKFNYFSVKDIVSKNNFDVTNVKTLYLLSLQFSLLSKKIGWLLFKFDKLLSFFPFGMIVYLKAVKN